MRAVGDVVNDDGDKLDDDVAVPTDEVDERSHVRFAPAGYSWDFLRGSYPGEAPGFSERSGINRSTSNGRTQRCTRTIALLLRGFFRLAQFRCAGDEAEQDAERAASDQP